MRVLNTDDPLPNRAGESWRMWLMTGVRRGPVDRRRVRGSHMGIKRMLVEGMAVRGDRAYTWKEFSDAMVRQAVGDAMQTLTYRDSQLVKLAYFAGMTNQEVADHLGMSEATVQRRLRVALDAISRFVERGRGLGQRLLMGVALWLSGRTASELMHGATQGVVVATAAAVIAMHPGSVPIVHHGGAPSAPTPSVSSTVPASAPAAAPVAAPVPSPTAPVSNTTSSVGVPTGAAPEVPSVQVPPGQMPPVQMPSVQVPTVKTPQLPQVPVKIKKVV